MTDGERKGRRFRFSVGALFASITIIGGFLGLLRLKWQLMNSDHLMEPLRDSVAFLPLSEGVWLLVLQIVSFAVATIAIFVYREPRVLWFYMVGHLVWFATLLIGALTQNVSFARWFGESMLAVLFLEPAFALVIVIVAWCLGLTRRRHRPVGILTALLILSLLSDLFAQLVWYSFAGALAAAIAASSR